MEAQTANAPVTRKFKMHEKLLYDTIRRQAGTLEKANVEAGMNSIEAGATAFHITLDDNYKGTGKSVMIFKDDGKGFKDETEIELFFETFGQPHGECENVVWKQFRMGRGQIFAYGKNTWLTGTFKMVVDIKEWGLSYEFYKNQPFVEGCEITVELYDNPIGQYPYYSMKTYKEAIQQQLRFVETPVFFNEEQINTPPSSCQWDSKDNQSYYLFNVGTDMLVYNLGVFVMKIPASKAGMGGIVVSREMLEVNFARNDVDSKCSIMRHINDVVRDNRIKKTRQKRRTLTNWEREATMSDLRDGQQELVDVKSLALIRTAQGKHVSLDLIRKNGQQWCFAELGSNLADRLMERGEALVIDKNILASMNYTGDKSKFFSWLTGADNDYNYQFDSTDWNKVEKLYTDFETLSAGISDHYTTSPDKKLTVVERRVLKVLNLLHIWDNRVINFGYSERAAAWTNGCSYITIDRNFFKSLYISSGWGVNKLMLLLSHEMAHDCDTRGTHVHGPEFYENQINVLEGRNSPTAYNSSFLTNMVNSKIAEKQAKIVAKEQKAEAKVAKKLGIGQVAASTK
jgi:hypothetical protein